MLINVPKADAQTEGGSPAASGAAPAPSAQQLARDGGNARPSAVPGPVVRKPGSDLMVDTLKELRIEYVAANPGSSFEGLQESLVNYGDPPNTMPEFITALHEESSVDMAHGYGKAEGRPMCALLHGTLGIQHASMAIYQAYYSGTPILLLAGRDDHFIQAHTANDMAAMVRSFTKWDAQPTSLMGCVEALREAYNQAVTPPTGPTLVILDMEFQKEEAAGLAVPKYQPPDIATIDTTTAREIAQALVVADNPRLAVGRLRTPEGVRRAVDLAELVGASTSTYATTGPMSFPQRHASCGPGANTDYDFTLGLEAGPADIGLVGAGINTQFETRDEAEVGFGGLRPAVPGAATGELPPDPSLIPRFAAGSAVGRRFDVDAEASLPLIIEEAERLISRGQRRTADKRLKHHGVANVEAHLKAVQEAVDDKRVGWDASPVSTARIYADQRRRLVPGIPYRILWQSPPRSLGSQQALQLSRRTRRGRDRLWPRSKHRCRARSETARALRHQRSVRRRYQLRAGRTLDCGASSTANAHGHAQQSRLAPGVNVPRVHGRCAWPRHRPDAYRHNP